MAETTVIRTKRDGLTVISDSAAAKTYTPAKEPGDFNYTVPGYSTTRPLDRGDFCGVRRVDAQAVTFGWSVYARSMGSASEATLPDICEDRGWWSTNATSTLGNASDEPTWNVAHTIDGSAFGEADQTLTFPDASLRGNFSEGDVSTYTVAGEAGILKPTFS